MEVDLFLYFQRVNKKIRGDNSAVKHETWAQLNSQDMRTIYADKTGTMYEALDEKGLIYPIEDLLAG